MNESLKKRFVELKEKISKNKNLNNIEKQCCPSFDDIKVATTINKKFRSQNFLETMSNILEWEDKNIHYWYERSDIHRAKKICLYGSIALFILITLSMIHVANILSSQNSMSKDVKDLLFGPILIIGILFGWWTGWELSSYVYSLYRNAHFIHKNSIKKKKHTMELVKAAVKLNSIQSNSSMCVEDILKYKTAICADYVKLNFAILVSLYPDKNFYVTSIPNHVGCAFEFNNTFYVLDQNLPLKQIDSWLIYHNRKKANIYKLKTDIINKPSLEYFKKYILAINNDVSEPQIDFLHIRNKICKAFNVTTDSKVGEEITIQIDKYFDNEQKLTFYDNITQDSFIKMIKKRIDAELYDTSHINSIEIFSDNSYPSLNQFISIRLWVTHLDYYEY